MLLAQLGLVQMIIVLIVVIAAIGILLVVVRQAGIAIPPWAIHIFWIVVVALVAIFAIRFLVGMAW